MSIENHFGVSDQEQIEKEDAKIGEKRSKTRSKLFDRQLMQELKDLGLTKEEYEEIFG